MLRLGLISLAVGVVIFAVALILDVSHLIVFGPCIGPGGLAVYIGLILTFGLGILLTGIGAIVWIAKRIRSEKNSF
jgi:hypothetical protein